MKCHLMKINSMVILFANFHFLVFCKVQRLGKASVWWAQTVRSDEVHVYLYQTCFSV